MPFAVACPSCSAHLAAGRGVSLTRNILMGVVLLVLAGSIFYTKPNP